jgi:anti-sigma factor RsiW
VHEEWTDKLSAYFDGELPDEEQRAVEAHLRGCAECAAVLNDLKRIVARAQGVGGAPHPPEADLWAGIAARIETSPRSVRLSRRSAAEANVEGAKAGAPRRVTFTLPQLAAAAAVLIAVSGTVTVKLMPVPTPPATAAATVAQLESPLVSEPSVYEPGTRVVPVSMADAQYDAAVADLEKALKQGRGRLDASTIAIVGHNLQIIDQAIDQAREALVTDPANTYLSGHLVEARRRKLDLLRRAAALSESN